VKQLGKEYAVSRRSKIEISENCCRSKTANFHMRSDFSETKRLIHKLLSGIYAHICVDPCGKMVATSSDSLGT
jgi:hypothetical protein